MINTTTLFGKVLAGLSQHVFGGEMATGLWLLVLFLGIGSMFKIAFSIILMALFPLTIGLMVAGWLPGAAGFPIIFFMAVILAFSFFQKR